MKSLFLNGQMTYRRKNFCLLTVLFIVIATIFLLIYPLFIESIQAKLEHAYDTIEVSGWLFNSRGYDEPDIQGYIWHTLMDTGNIGTNYAFTNVDIKLFNKQLIASKTNENSTQHELIAAFNALSEELAGDNTYKSAKSLQALNIVEANQDLWSAADEIQWLNGYSADKFFSGNELTCLISEKMGYQLGDWVPLRIKSLKSDFTVICLKVVGTYSFDVHSEAMGDLEMFLPILTFEKICLSQENGSWDFWLNGFSFIVKDNRQLPALKTTMADLELAGGPTGLNIRAAIDDRILDGTVAPIKSNLAMLEGLYKFFFVVVAAIGFFLCFLLARGRKQEYAVMRLLGESAFQVTWKAILEQLILCLMGIVLGAVILMVADQGAPDLATCGVILCCYTLGAAVAVILTVRVNVMEILRDKE